MEQIKVFVCGSKNLTVLTKLEQLTIDRFINKKVLFLIGDCYGIDKAIQQYLFDKGYTDVVIYATDGKVRNNVGNYLLKAIPSNGCTGY